MAVSTATNKTSLERIKEPSEAGSSKKFTLTAKGSSLLGHLSELLKNIFKKKCLKNPSQGQRQPDWKEGTIRVRVFKTFSLTH